MTRLRDINCEPEYALNPLLDPATDIIPFFVCLNCHEKAYFNAEESVACNGCEHWFCHEECLIDHVLEAEGCETADL